MKMRMCLTRPEIADHGERGSAEERISALLKRYRKEEMGTCLAKKLKDAIRKTFPEVRPEIRPEES